jgi:hypothetical protein
MYQTKRPGNETFQLCQREALRLLKQAYGALGRGAFGDVMQAHVDARGTAPGQRNVHVLDGSQ